MFIPHIIKSPLLKKRNTRHGPEIIGKDLPIKESNEKKRYLK